MDQHALARLHVGQLLQGVIHRQEHRGHRGCGFKRPALRHESHRISAGDDVAGKARGTKAHDGIALLQMRHTAANAADDAGELQPQAGSSKTFFQRLIGQQAHEVHHVAKVQARGLSAHFDFMRLQRRGLLRQPQQVAQLAGHQEIELEACALLCCLAGWLHGCRRWCMLQQHRNMAGLFGQQNFILAVGLQQLTLQLRQQVGLRRGSVQVNQGASQLRAFIHRYTRQAPQRRLGWTAQTLAGNDPQARRRFLLLHGLHQLQQAGGSGDAVLRAVLPALHPNDVVCHGSRCVLRQYMLPFGLQALLQILGRNCCPLVCQQLPGLDGHSLRHRRIGNLDRRLRQKQVGTFVQLPGCRLFDQRRVLPATIGQRLLPCSRCQQAGDDLALAVVPPPGAIEPLDQIDAPIRIAFSDCQDCPRGQFGLYFCQNRFGIEHAVQAVLHDDQIELRGQAALGSQLPISGGIVGHDDGGVLLVFRRLARCQVFVGQGQHVLQMVGRQSMQGRFRQFTQTGGDLQHPQTLPLRQSSCQALQQSLQQAARAQVSRVGVVQRFGNGRTLQLGVQRLAGIRINQQCRQGCPRRAQQG